MSSFSRMLRNQVALYSTCPLRACLIEVKGALPTPSQLRPDATSPQMVMRRMADGGLKDFFLAANDHLLACSTSFACIDTALGCLVSSGSNCKHALASSAPCWLSLSTM